MIRNDRDIRLKLETVKKGGFGSLTLRRQESIVILLVTVGKLSMKLHTVGNGCSVEIVLVLSFLQRSADEEKSFILPTINWGSEKCYAQSWSSFQKNHILLLRALNPFL